MAAKAKSIKKVAAQPVSKMVNVTLKKLREKFKRLRELNEQLADVKALYQEKDLLMEQLLPLFVKVRKDRIVIRRSYTIGSQTFRLSTHLYDELKGRINAKTWKSTAFPTATIE